MTQQAEILNKIDKIPQKYFGEVIDFLGYLQHKAQQESQQKQCANSTETEQESNEVTPIPTDSNGKFLLTKEVIEEMEKNSPTLHELAGILHTDMTLDEIRMARLAKHL